MRKRIICFMLGIALVSSLFTGCGKDTAKENTKEKETSSATVENDNNEKIDEDISNEEDKEDEEEIKVLGNGSKILRDGNVLYFQHNNGIYKYDMVSSEKEPILGSEGIDSLYLVGEWLYFQDDNGINRVKTDGTELTCILEDSDNLSIKAINCGHIYFTGKINNKNGLHSIELDGSNIRCVHSDIYSPYNIITKDNLMYYNCSDGVYVLDCNYNIRNTILLVPTYRMWSDAEYIYISGAESPSEGKVKGHIYRVKEDGTDAKLLIQADSKNYKIITVNNGWIYYEEKDYSNNNQTKIYRMTVTGENIQEVVMMETVLSEQAIGNDDVVHYKDMDNNDLYCVSDNGGISHININSSDEEYLTFVECVDEEYIYYRGGKSWDTAYAWYIFDITETNIVKIQ